jgi:hypothetical protein
MIAREPGPQFSPSVDHEYNHSDRRYYSVDGYQLRDGLRAALGEHG